MPGMGVVWELLGRVRVAVDLLRDLLVKWLLLLLLRWVERKTGWGLDVGDGNGLLRPRLMHGKGHVSVLLESGSLRQWIRLSLRHHDRRCEIGYRHRPCHDSGSVEAVLTCRR